VSCFTVAQGWRASEPALRYLMVGAYRRLRWWLVGVVQNPANPICRGDPSNNCNDYEEVSHVRSPEEFLPISMVRLTGWCRSSKPWRRVGSTCRPNNIPTRTQLSLFDHCVGLTLYLLAPPCWTPVPAGPRRRISRPGGPVAEIWQTVRALQQDIQEDLNMCTATSPLPSPEALRQPAQRTWTQGRYRAASRCTNYWRKQPRGTWNSCAM